jgi:CBS domain-containing protein
VADNTDTKSVQERGRAAITSAAQRTTDAVREGAERMADAGHVGRDIAQQTAITVTEAARHLGDTAGESISHGAHQVAGTQQKFAQEVARDFAQNVGRMAEILQETAQDWQALVQLRGVGGGRLQEVSATMSNAVDRVMEVNLRTAEQLFRMSGPAAILELQQQFARQYLHALLEGSTAIVQAVRQAAEQALHPLEQRKREREQQHRNGGQGQQAERVADVMSRDVKLVSPDENVRHVAQMMREADTGVLPVAEGDRLVGMLTDRDVAVRLVAEGRDPGQTKVRDVMTSDVRYVFEDEDLEHVAENMAEQRVRRLPVMNRQKRVVGVVSLGDIARRQQPLAGKALIGISRERGPHTQVAAE